MDDYEVDLIDYLRVMWKGKWIILGVFVAAIAVALIISLRTPNQYEAQAVVSLNRLPNIAGVELEAPSPQMLLAALTFDHLTARTVQEAGLAEEEPSQGLSQAERAAWLKGQIHGSVREGTPLIEVKVRAALDPQLLDNILSMHLRILGEWVAENVTTQAKREITRLAVKETVLNAQRADLVQEIKAKIADSVSILQGEQDHILKQLDAITADKENLQLPAGEQNGTLQGIMLRGQFDALNTRLQGVEQNLDALKTKGQQQFPALRSWILDLNQQIQQLEVAAEEVQRILLSGSWQGLDVVSVSSEPLTPVGPNRKMSVAVAGVLGLFVGVLLAFFIHYLVSAPAREPEHKRT